MHTYLTIHIKPTNRALLGPGESDQAGPGALLQLEVLPVTQGALGRQAGLAGVVPLGGVLAPLLVPVLTSDPEC